MPVLTNGQQDLIAQNPRVNRGGYVVPMLNANIVFPSACWNWALCGGTAQVVDDRNPAEIYNNILTYGWELPPDPLHPVNQADQMKPVQINDVDNDYPGSAADFTILRDNLQNARNEQANAKRNFRFAMTRIVARKSGFTPIGVGSHFPYTLHMRTNKWYGWDHWALGIRVHAGEISYIQKVPDTPVYYNEETMWDEGRTLTSIGVNGFLQCHINALNNIGNMLACCLCGLAVQDETVAGTNRWRGCDSCGRYFCRTCKHQLSFGFWGTLTRKRKCICSEKTRRLYSTGCGL